VSKPRSITTVTPSALRYCRKSTSICFQRRWASGEAEAKNSEEEQLTAADEQPPISAEEPTAEEQVEDEIHTDNAAEQFGSETAVNEAAATSPAEPIHQSGKSLRTDTAPSVSTPGDESTSRINAAADAVKETLSKTLGGFAETARNATGMGRDSNDSRGGRSDFVARSASGTMVEPKSTIYIGNLFFDVTENDLVKELTRFGTITKCRLIRDSRGLSKGYVSAAPMMNYRK
jgi:nucleolin